MRDLTINLLRILNWNNSIVDTKIELQFISAHNRAHISHKSLLGNFAENTLILNAAFKISYQQNQNKIICKVSIIKQNRIKEVIGEAEIDLDCFLQRKVLFVPFHNHDQLLEIHKAQQLNDDELYLQMNQTRNQDKMKATQEEFLHQRYNFLERISKKQSQLKREFSQKVYNLLKDVKYARPEANSKKTQVDNSYSKDFHRDQKDENNRGYKGNHNPSVKETRQQNKKYQTPQKEENYEILQQRESKKKILDSIKNKHTYTYTLGGGLDENQSNIPNNNLNRINQKPKNMNLMINSLQVLQNDQKRNRERQLKIEREAILNQIKQDALMQKYYEREKKKQ